MSPRLPALLVHPRSASRGRRPARWVVALAAAPLVLALAGCGDGDAEDDPAPSASVDQPSTSAPTSPSGSSSGSTSEVVPTDGTELETQDAVRLRLPREGAGPGQSEKWVAVGDGTRTTTAAGNVGVGTVEITLSEFPTSSTDYEDVAGDDLEVYGDFRSEAEITRAADREVAGLDGWVLTGLDASYRHYSFGTIHAGVAVTIRFRVPVDLTDPDGLVESVLASVEWK